MVRPRVGEPRIYAGPIDVLYPGERAVAQVAPADLLRARMTGEPVRPSEWMVEPEPGLAAAYRRWRYRLVGQFVDEFRALRRHVREMAAGPAPEPPTGPYLAALLLDGVFPRRWFWCVWLAVVLGAALWSGS